MVAEDYPIAGDYRGIFVFIYLTLRSVVRSKWKCMVIDLCTPTQRCTEVYGMVVRDSLKTVFVQHQLVGLREIELVRPFITLCYLALSGVTNAFHVLVALSLPYADRSIPSPSQTLSQVVTAAYVLHALTTATTAAAPLCRAAASAALVAAARITEQRLTGDDAAPQHLSAAKRLLEELHGRC